MKTKGKGHIDKAWLGLEESYADPTHEGEYHDAYEPVTHPNEYAEDAARFRAHHGTQSSFPAGDPYGGDEGSGKKFPGSKRKKEK